MHPANIKRDAPAIKAVRLFIFITHMGPLWPSARALLSENQRDIQTLVGKTRANAAQPCRLHSFDLRLWLQRRKKRPEQI